jgi:hypothetical protein
MVQRRSRKVPFNCYLSVEQLDALDSASETEGRPRAEIVREAVAQYLAGYLSAPEDGDLSGPPVLHEDGAGEIDEATECAADSGAGSITERMTAP